MDEQEILKAIKEARGNSKKRNFIQKFDLVVNLKDLDLKKAEHQVESYVPLQYNTGKKLKIAAFIGPELSAQKDAVDLAISQEDFPKYGDKKVLKKLSREYDYFIAQADLMSKVATSFGRVLGPKGKMPNPKAGCIVPPNANLKAVYERLQKVVRISAKAVPIVQCVIGNEESKDEEIADNALTVYNNLVHALPNETHNIKNAFIKLTMGKPARIGEKESEMAEEPRKKSRIKKAEEMKEIEKPVEKTEVKKIEEEGIVKEKVEKAKVKRGKAKEETKTEAKKDKKRK